MMRSVAAVILVLRAVCLEAAVKGYEELHQAVLASNTDEGFEKRLQRAAPGAKLYGGFDPQGPAVTDLRASWEILRPGFKEVKHWFAHWKLLQESSRTVTFSFFDAGVVGKSGCQFDYSGIASATFDEAGLVTELWWHTTDMASLMKCFAALQGRPVPPEPTPVKEVKGWSEYYSAMQRMNEKGGVERTAGRILENATHHSILGDKAIVGPFREYTEGFEKPMQTLDILMVGWLPQVMTNRMVTFSWQHGYIFKDGCRAGGHGYGFVTFTEKGFVERMLFHSADSSEWMKCLAAQKAKGEL